MSTKKAEIPWDPNRGREILEGLLREAEMEAEIERLDRMTPEQVQEEARSKGIKPFDAARAFARALDAVNARASELAAPPERSLADQLEDVIDEAWVKRIAAMTPDKLRELAGESRSLTDEQAEAILRRAKGWIEERQVERSDERSRN